MSFQQVLYNLRTAHGLSQQELADALSEMPGVNISQSSIGLYESGARFPRRKNMEALAEFFHVPASTFYIDDDSSDQELATYIINRMHTDPEYRVLFDVSRNVRSSDLAAVNQILKSIARERESDE